MQTFVTGMRTAHEEGSKAAVVAVYGEEVSYLFRPYAEKSRRMLIEKLQVHMASASAQDNEELRKIMSNYALDGLYMPMPTASL